MRCHSEMTGDALGLIHAAASRPPHINLLQGYNVGLAACDDGCNARRIHLAIGAAAGVNIIGQYPDKPALRRAWRGLVDHRSGTRLAALRSACSIDHCGAKAGMSWMKLVLRIVVVVAIGAAAVLLYRALSRYTMAELAASLQSIPLHNALMALAFAACSYLCLTGFDWLAVRYAGKPLAWRRTALASFSALSVGHNIGVAALSSGAIRYRFYSRWGLDTGDVAKVILFCGLTVGLGLVTLGGLGLILYPSEAQGFVGLGRSALRVLAV